VRNSRSCNALAFCNVDPNYLAVGLDKVRGDSSFIIWDIQSATPSLPLSKSSTLEKDAIAMRPQPQIARANVVCHCTNRRVLASVLQQYVPTDIVSTLSFLPRSTHLLLAGISARWLRLFDLRTLTTTTTNIEGPRYRGIPSQSGAVSRLSGMPNGSYTPCSRSRRKMQQLTGQEHHVLVPVSVLLLLSTISNFRAQEGACSPHTREFIRPILGCPTSTREQFYRWGEVWV
jgi:hypothetical protein